MVLIGPPEAIPGMKDRLNAGDRTHTFTSAEAVEALDYIVRHKPGIVALELEFSSSSRGAALIERIKADPSLTACEVRIVAHDSEISRVAVKRGHPVGGAAVAVDEPKPVLDQRGTRRAARVRIKDGVEVAVDGNPSALVDLSTVGAQVVSASVLKPNQRVRVIMGEGKAAARCNGAIAWASFEMPKGLSPRYRAGIDFQAADADAVGAFAEKNKK